MANKATIDLEINGIDQIDQLALSMDRLDKTSKKLDQSQMSVAQTMSKLADLQVKFDNAADPAERAKYNDQLAITTIELQSQEKELAKLKIQYDSIQKETNTLQKAQAALGKNTKDLSKDLKESESAFSVFGIRVKDVIGQLKTPVLVAGGLLGIGGIVSGLANTFNEMRSEIDATNKAATGLGLTQAEFKAFEIAAGDAGTSIDTFTDAIKTSSNIVGKQLIAPTAKASKAFETLGLDVAELADMTAQQRFDAIYGELGNLTNETEKAAIATQLFGSSFATSMANMSDDAFKRATSDVEQFGLALDSDATANLASFNDNWERLGFISKGFSTQIMSALAPALDTALQYFIDLGVSGKEFGKFVGDGITLVIKGIRILIGVVLEVKNLWDGFIGVINFFVGTSAVNLLKVIKSIILAFLNGGAGIKNFFIDMFNLLIDNVSRGVEIILAGVNKILGYFGKAIDTEKILADINSVKLENVKMKIETVGNIDTLITTAEQMATRGVKGVTTSIKEMGNATSEAVNAVVKDVNTAIDKVGNSTKNTRSVGKAQAQAYATGLTEGVNDIRKVNDKLTKEAEKLRLQSEKEEAKKRQEALKAQQKEQERMIKEQTAIIGDLFKPISSGLDNIIAGTASVTESFNQMVKDIIIQLTRLAAQKAFTAFFGGGNDNWAVNAAGMIGGYFGSSGSGAASFMQPMAQSLSASPISTVNNNSSTLNRNRSANVTINVVGTNSSAETGRQLGVQIQRTLQSAFR